MQTVTIEFPRAVFETRSYGQIERQVILLGGTLVERSATMVRLEDEGGPRWQRGTPSPDPVKLVARYDDVLSASMQTPEQFEQNLVKTMDLIWRAERLCLQFPGGPELVFQDRRHPGKS